MPSVTISRRHPEQSRMPSMCAKTGAPTDDSIRLSGSAAPGWTGAMILFGLFAWAFAAAMSGRRYALELPFKREVLKRHRAWRRAGLILLALGPLLAIIAGAAGRDNAWLLLGISLAGVVFLVGNEWKNGLGVSLTAQDELLVTRVHPDFERAWWELNRR